MAKMNKILLSFGIATAVFITGCGGSKPPETAKEESAAPAAAPTAADDANAATVTGKVSFSGEKPAARNIDMSANPACARARPKSPEQTTTIAVAMLPRGRQSQPKVTQVLTPRPGPDRRDGCDISI